MRRTLIALTAALGLAAPAFAGEGVLPVRAGDRVEGTLARCGDRHVLRLDLTRGEVLRARVDAERAFAADITLRIYGPDGTLVNTEANVRGIRAGSKLGPFQVTETGTYHVQLSTFTRHELDYVLRTTSRRRPRARVRLRGTGTRRFTAAAGSVVRVRGGGAARGVSLTLPGDDELVLAAGSACLTALTSSGLAVPAGGQYTVALADGGRARLVAQPPARRSGRTLEFPALPDDAAQVAAWYDDSGWVADPLRQAPADHEPPSTTRPTEPTPLPPVEPGLPSVIVAPNAPSSPESGLPLGDAQHEGGVASGVGMPIAPVPTIEQALGGSVEPFGEGPSYVFDVEHAELGTLSYRVHFVVGGGVTQAPVSARGGVTMRWAVSGGGTATHEGRWTLTWDGPRGVEVLEGSETLIDASSRHVQSAANGFSLRSDGGPSAGRLTYSVSWLNGPFPGGEFRRVETYDGLGATETVIE